MRNEQMMMDNRSRKQNGLSLVIVASLTAMALIVTSCSPKGRADSTTDVSAGQKLAKVKEIAESEFDSEVVNSGQPVVVKFHADWCPPCKVLSPIMEDLANDHGGKVKFVAVDVDQAQGLAEKYQIEGLPSVLFFKDGKITDRVLGLEQKEELRKRITAVEQHS